MRAVIIFLIFACIVTTLNADEVCLKNSDKITGIIEKESSDAVVVNTKAMGKISIDKRHIDRIIREDNDSMSKKPEPEAKPEITEQVFSGEVRAGYNTTRGNTETEQFHAAASLNIKREKIDEVTLGGDMYYSSSDKKMDAQKWYVMGRYAFSFGEQKKWYNFYKVEGDHDRFANVDYRLIPGAGLGYWFFDEADTKFLLEAALGWEYTNYRDDTDDEGVFVVVPRAFFEKKLFENIMFSQEAVMYPKLKDIGDYRLRAESVLTFDLNDKFSIKVSFIDDYNSDPAGDAKENDMTFLSALVYKM